MTGFISCTLIAAGAWPACHNNLSPTADTIVFVVEKVNTVYDPRYAADAFSLKLCQLLYSGVMEANDEMQMVPLLAREIKQPDAKTYEVILRQGVLFHDGVELTAADVVYTYNSVMDRTRPSPWNFYFDLVKKIEQTGRYSLRIRLKQPHALFLYGLFIGIVPRHLVERPGYELSHNPVGSGPFQLLKQDDTQSLLIGRFEQYFASRTKPTKVLFRAVPDGTVRLLEMESGRADFLQNDFPRAMIPRLQKDPRFSFSSLPSNYHMYIGFNLRHPILKKKEVRQAIAYAIDRRAIIEYRYLGTVRPANSALSPKNQAFTDRVKTYDYNPQLAARLLDAAGYPAQGSKSRFTLEFSVSTNPSSLEVVKVISTQLRQVGIAVAVRSLEWASYFERINKGNFELFSLESIDQGSPDLLYFHFHSKMLPPYGNNRGYYLNPLVDRLLERGRQEADLRQRQKIYAEVQEILAQELPRIYLWYPDNLLLASNRVKGYKLRPMADYYYLANTEIVGR